MRPYLSERLQTPGFRIKARSYLTVCRLRHYVHFACIDQGQSRYYSETYLTLAGDILRGAIKANRYQNVQLSYYAY